MSGFKKSIYAALLVGSVYSPARADDKAVAP
jgi:hypothetical protein